jgi:hypothetical protein
MRQLMMAAAVSGAALLAFHGTASAQLAIETPAGGVYVGPSYYNDYYYEPYGPRVYGYYYDDYDRGYRTRARERYSDRQKCGRRAYWDGQTCLPGYRP